MPNKTQFVTVLNEEFGCEGATAYITHYPCIICCRLLEEQVELEKLNI